MKPYEQTYEVLSTLGKGGMGSVYLVRHLRLGTLWALKEVKKQAGSTIDLLAEANLLKRLSHPALPRIIDIYEDESTIYIVEDYIEGVSLDQRLREDGKYPEPQARKWLEELCDVLAYLHGQPNPIIYRDMKPSNIMVAPDGRVKLIDFGIAREYKQESAGDTSMLGTLGYAAPEQYGLAQSDARTDIYSLGVTLYHTLTGKSPMDPPYELRPIRQWDSSYSEGMEYIIAKCTRLDPAERYQNISELQHDLRNIERFSSRNRRRRIWNAVKLATCAALIVSGGVLIAQGYSSIQKEAEEAYAAAYNEGIALLEGNELDAAERVLVGADASSHWKTDGHVAFAAALMSVGQYERCVTFAQNATESYPSLGHNAQLNYCWGVALDSLGKTVEALEKYRAADEAQPGNELYQRNLARAYAATGDIEKANALLESLTQAGSSESTAFVYAGILEAQKDYNGAEREYRSCIEGKDDTVGLAAYRALESMYKAQRSSEPEVVEKEIALLLEMQSAFPGKEEAFRWERLGEAYFARGVLRGSSEDLKSSISAFESLISLGYGRASTYLNIAIVYQRLKEYDAAKQALLELLDRFPSNADACIQMAYLVAEQESQKEQTSRNYSDVLSYYELAVANGASGESRQRLEGIIADLRAGGWIR